MLSGASNGQSDLESSDGNVRALPDPRVTILRGHLASVYNCAWNPSTEVLATGSGDGTARLWNMSCPEIAHLTSSLLQHQDRNEMYFGRYPMNNDIITLDWSPSGHLLVTGSADGRMRTWGADGELLSVLQPHRGGILGIKYNKINNLVVTCGSDMKSAVTDCNTGMVVQRYHHSAPIRRVDWQTNTIFASCCTHSIYICDITVPSVPIRTFREHLDEINTIKWDPQGAFLASASEDSTLKIWTSDQDTSIYTLAGHALGVRAIKWSPTGPGTRNPTSEMLLASGSVDKSVGIWNPEIGLLLHLLPKHTETVCTVDFSPDGRYVVSGAKDKCVHIWDAHNALLMRSFYLPAPVTDVAWCPGGAMVVASSEGGDVAAFDVRNL